MPSLTLRFEQQDLKKYEVEKGSSLTIGRRNTNDIVIENLGVSNNHAKIDSIEDRFLLTDLQSKNGTFVNEKLITTHWLQHGDRITIGKHTLIFLYTGGEARPEKESAALEQTMVMDTDQYHAMLAKNIKQSEAAGSVVEKETIGVLTYLSGGSGNVKLTRKLSRIGKDPLCDVVVGGFVTGKTAATVSNRPNGFYLTYVGGMSKPKVNGATVKDTVKLEEFDIIEIGSAKLQFTLDYKFNK